MKRTKKWLKRHRREKKQQATVARRRAKYHREKSGREQVRNDVRQAAKAIEKERQRPLMEKRGLSNWVKSMFGVKAK